LKTKILLNFQTKGDVQSLKNDNLSPFYLKTCQNVIRFVDLAYKNGMAP